MELFKEGELSADAKNKLIDRFPSLTERDFEENNHRKLLIHLQQKLGKTKEEMRKIIKEV